MQSLFNAYRPKNFDEVVGQKETVTLLRQQSKTNKYRNAYIFAGHFGSGKTSLARIFAMALNCHCKDENGNPCGVCDTCKSIMEGNNADVIEYAASENTGVEGADRLIDATKYAPIGDHKVFIIDEVQALTAQAFQRLLKITEEPPKYCVFIFCTTEYESIPAANRSRIQKYNFTQFTNEEIADRVRFVAEDAGLEISEDVPEVIAKYAEGSMRNAIVTLETATEHGRATGETVEAVLGVVRNDVLFDIIQAVGDNDVKACVEALKSIMSAGFNLTLLFNELLSIVKDLYVYRACRVVEGTEAYKEKIRETDIGLAELQRLSEVLVELKGKKLTENLIFLGLVSLIKPREKAAPVMPAAEVVATPVPEIVEMPNIPEDVPVETETAAEPEEIDTPDADLRPVTPTEKPKAKKTSKKKDKPKADTGFEDFFDMFGFGEGEKAEEKAEEKESKEVSDDPFGFKEAINIDAAPIEQIAAIVADKTEGKREEPVAPAPVEDPFGEDPFGANPFDDAPEEKNAEEPVVTEPATIDDACEAESFTAAEETPFDDVEVTETDTTSKEPSEEKREFVPEVMTSEADAPDDDEYVPDYPEDEEAEEEGELEPVYPLDVEEELVREGYFRNNFAGFDASDIDSASFAEAARNQYAIESGRLDAMAEKICDGEVVDNAEAVFVIQLERASRYYFEITCPDETEYVTSDADVNKLKRLAEGDKVLKQVLAGCFVKNGRLFGVKALVDIAKALGQYLS